VQYISDRDSRVMDEVGFWIPRVGFRIPGTGFQIPKPWIPDSKSKIMFDSGFRIPLHEARNQSEQREAPYTNNVFSFIPIYINIVSAATCC